MEIFNRARTPIEFVEVTPRDGEQQEKKHEYMSPEDRTTVFDAIVDTGITQVEIGHLFNEHDQIFARHLVEHIKQKSDEGDERYDSVVLQVLFGTRDGEVETGTPCLNGFPKDRVVLHIYDRLSESLRNLASEPYSPEESAERISKSCRKGIEYGFTRFSITGEGAVDPDSVTVKEAVGFFKPIVQKVWQEGATTVNVNLANTFGVALHDVGEWDSAGLKKFNKQIKNIDPRTTTSIHTHNDNHGGVEFAMASIKAGFDKVEGSLTGMGERSGNVALVDFMSRCIENARVYIETSEQNKRKDKIERFMGNIALRNSLWRKRYIEEPVLSNLDKWYDLAFTISEVYDTHDSFEATTLGSPNAYRAGCGPHGGANERSIQDPVKHPFWKSYARIALIRGVMGDPKAIPLIRGEIEAHRKEVIPTHAKGGSYGHVHNPYGGVIEAKPEVKNEAERIFKDDVDRIIQVMSGV